MIGVTTDMQHGLTAEDVRQCGFTMARFVLRWSEDPSEFLRACYARGIKTIGVWTWEALAPDADNGGSAAQWAQWLGEQDLWKTLTYVQIENEVDLHQWEQSTYNFLVTEVAPHFHEHCLTLTSGLASGNPDWLDGVDLSLLDLIAIHPYGRWPDGDRIWREEYTEWGSPVAVSYTHLTLPTILRV